MRKLGPQVGGGQENPSTQIPGKDNLVKRSTGNESLKVGEKEK